jgi:ribose transport system ATP-binding protein
MPDPRPVLVAERFSKSFGGTAALRGVDLAVDPGEIHGLVGRNGSGKSTLIKLLAGYHAPDSPDARLTLRDRPVPLPVDPAKTRELGLHFIHQDLGLVPTLSVMENMRVRHYGAGLLGWISWRRERAAVRAALREFGLDASPDTQVSSLSSVERALLAIARALTELRGDGRSGVLVLDEPTAYLSRDAVERLFQAIQSVARRGTAVIFVSHRLDEITRLTDRVSVLRDGTLIGTVDTARTAEADLIEMILGRSLDDLYPDHHAAEAETWMSVERLSGRVVTDVALDLRQGEILGLTGLVGMGHEEVPYLLVGASRPSLGVLRTGDRVLQVERLTPRAARGLGMALLPGDRQNGSGVGALTVGDNVSLPVLSTYFRRGVLRHRRRDASVTGLLETYGVRPARPEMRLDELSGGNQQKALLAKWLQCAPALLLLDEPTQGVDVGAKKDIFAHISAVAEAGTAVVISSSEYEDLARLCDRVAVFRKGRVAAVLRGADLTEERIVEQSYRTALAAKGASSEGAS